MHLCFGDSHIYTHTIYPRRHSCTHQSTKKLTLIPEEASENLQKANNTCMHIHMYLYIYMYVFIFICLFIHIYIRCTYYVHMYVSIYIYIYKYVYIRLTLVGGSSSLLPMVETP